MVRPLPCLARCLLKCPRRLRTEPRLYGLKNTRCLQETSAKYIETVISRNWWGLEGYLAKARNHRTIPVGVFSLCGNDHVIAISYALLYLGAGLAIMFTYQAFAGTLKRAYTILMAVDSVFFLITIYMVIRAALRYRSIGRESS